MDFTSRKRGLMTMMTRRTWTWTRTCIVSPLLLMTLGSISSFASVLVGLKSIAVRCFSVSPAGGAAGCWGVGAVVWHCCFDFDCGLWNEMFVNSCHWLVTLSHVEMWIPKATLMTCILTSCASQMSYVWNTSKMRNPADCWLLPTWEWAVKT